MKKEEIDEFISDLDICYKSCQAPYTSLFFKSLSEYLDLIKNHPFSQKILKLMMLEKSKFLIKLKKLEIETFNELKNTSAKINQFINENFKFSLMQFKPQFEENATMWSDLSDFLIRDVLIDELYDDIYKKLLGLYKNEYIDFAKQYVNPVGKDGGFLEVTFSPHYKEYQIEKEIIEKNKDAKILYYYDKLNFYHNIFLKYQKYKKDEKGITIVPFEYKLFHELDKILENEEMDEIKYFKESNFKAYLNKFHSYIESFIKKKPSKHLKLKFRKSILYYGNQPIKEFKKIDIERFLVSLLFENKERKLEFDKELDIKFLDWKKNHKRFEEKNLTPRYFYHVFHDINDLIKNETEKEEDFLSYSNSEVSIKEEYI